MTIPNILHKEFRHWLMSRWVHSGKLTMENGPGLQMIFLKTGEISIAMLIYQRVYGIVTLPMLGGSNNAKMCGNFEGFAFTPPPKFKIAPEKRWLENRPFLLGF